MLPNRRPVQSTLQDERKQPEILVLPIQTLIIFQESSALTSSATQFRARIEIYSDVCLNFELISRHSRGSSPQLRRGTSSMRATNSLPCMHHLRSEWRSCYGSFVCLQADQVQFRQRLRNDIFSAMSNAPDIQTTSWLGRASRERQ